MDALLSQLRKAFDESKFKGTFEDFKTSEAAITWALNKNRILRLQPQDLAREHRKVYTQHLTKMTKEYLQKNKNIKTWRDFAEHADNKSVHKILHQFGVRGEVFGIESFQDEAQVQKTQNPTSITILELYELYQIQHHYNGTFSSFKRVIQRKYGSFAEFCIKKGYDINSSKWESDESAVRVAKALGSISEVKKRSTSLMKYLTENDLLESTFSSSAV
jgi:hypothetical protein